MLPGASHTSRGPGMGCLWDMQIHVAATSRKGPSPPMHGGIYGKGPTLYLKAAEADRCVHSWHSISREDFQSRAGRRRRNPRLDGPRFCPGCAPWPDAVRSGHLTTVVASPAAGL